MGDFAIIQRSPGGLGGYTTRIGKRRIWTSGGIDHVVSALVEDTKVKGKAALRLANSVRIALELFKDDFALVALPEKRRARKAVR